MLSITQKLSQKIAHMTYLKLLQLENSVTLITYFMRARI